MPDQPEDLTPFYVRDRWGRYVIVTEHTEVGEPRRYPERRPSNWRDLARHAKRLMAEYQMSCKATARYMGIPESSLRGYLFEVDLEAAIASGEIATDYELQRRLAKVPFSRGIIRVTFDKPSSSRAREGGTD